MKQQYSSDRPNLKKESVAFAAVKGVGYGALVGGALSPVFNFLGNLGREAAEKNSLTSGIIGTMAAVGALSGIFRADESSERNHVKAAVKPYVERLENELDAKTAALNLLTRN